MWDYLVFVSTRPLVVDLGSLEYKHSYSERPWSISLEQA